MDLRLLRYFQRIAELGSLSKAAVELGFSQPALTRQMMRLEHDLGVTLLIRDSRGVRPTEAGELLLARVRPLVEQAQLIEDELAAWRGTPAGEVALCMPVSFHISITRPLVSEIRRTLPGIRLRVIDGLDTLLHDQLRDGLVDLGVMMYDEERIIDGVDQTPLARDRLMLMGRIGDFAPGGAVRLEQLVDLPFILPGARNHMRQRLDGVLRKQGYVLDVVVEADTARLINDLVRSGEGFSVTPEAGLKTGIGDGLAAWPIERLSIEWALCIQQKRRASPTVRKVADLLTVYLDHVLKPTAGDAVPPRL
jgi:LysR family nitrogen assimilation transcriptional regulator